MTKHFVVVQPGCDVTADDIIHLVIAPDVDNNRYMLGYLFRRGVDQEFIDDAEIGDVQFFNRECYIMRVGRVWNGKGWE